jgi:hypothetical protein
MSYIPVTFNRDSTTKTILMRRMQHITLYSFLSQFTLKRLTNKNVNAIHKNHTKLDIAKNSSKKLQMYKITHHSSCSHHKGRIW